MGMKVDESKPFFGPLLHKSSSTKETKKGPMVVINIHGPTLQMEQYLENQQLPREMKQFDEEPTGHSIVVTNSSEIISEYNTLAENEDILDFGADYLLVTRQEQDNGSEEVQ